MFFERFSSGKVSVLIRLIQSDFELGDGVTGSW